ncbi:MAG: prepilin-type N-terminal cleavage/methylation domain-containing protein [Planctomycetota bacterium]|jgi:type II secretory pathway pseudopilin PulG
MDRDCQKHQQGSSLIELMVAAMISLVLVGAVLSTVIQQGHQRRATSESSLALSAALNNLEQLRTVPEATLPLMDGKGFDVPGSNGAPGGLQPVPGDFDGLPGQFTVLVDQSKGGVRLYRVVATVAWTGVSGRRTIRLQALMGERK